MPELLSPETLEPRLPVTVDPVLAAPARRAVGTELAVDNDLGASLTWRIQVNGEQLLSRLRRDGQFIAATDRLIVPILQFDYSAESGITLHVHAGSDQRAALPYPKHFLTALAPTHDLYRYVCIDFRADELKLQPIVSITQHTDVLRDTFRFRGGFAFLPVGHVRLPLEGKLVGAKELTVRLPDEVDSTHVLFQCVTTFVWTLSNEAELNRLTADRAWGNLLHYLGERIDRYLAPLGPLADETHHKISSRDEARSLKSLEQDLRDWRSTFVPGDVESLPPEDQEAASNRAIARFREILAESHLEVGLIAERDSNGSIAVDSLSFEPLVITGMEMSYTDSSISNQRRPVYLLALLVIVELLVAWRLTSRFDLWPLTDGFSVDVARDYFNFSREALAAILLLFPSLLYAEVLRSRPHTRARRRALFGYSSLMAFGFLMPVLLSVFAVGPPEPVVMMRCLLAASAVAAILCMFALQWTRPKRLAQARLSALMKD